MFFKTRTPKPAKSRLANQLENGTLDVGTPEFRRLCAIKADGVCLVANGYQHTAEMRTERKKLVASGLVPAIRETRIVALSEVAEAYNVRAPRAGEKSDGAAVTNSFDVRVRVEDLLSDCANARASDLAIVLRDFHTDLRMKVGGAWHDFKDQWTRDEGRIALECLFNAREDGSGQTVREQRSFQSFSITSTETLRLPRGVVKLRGQRGFHETAADIGDHHVFRFFYNEGDKNTSTIEGLGFDTEILEAFERMRHSSDGAMIVGGSTGDGKSTTLIRSVQRLIEEKHGRTSVVTIEDPVEMRLDHPAIVQIPVSSAGDGDAREEVYRRALMHFSRVNPDVGIISEMRDGYGARQVLQFVSSGHMCYTTIHTNSANEIPFRLIGWGIPAAEIARPGMVKVMVQQKLVPHLCPECAVPFDGSQTLPKYVRVLDSEQLADLRFRNEDGCPACLKDYTGVGRVAWAGYQRLIAVGELVEPDDTYLACIGRNDGLGAMQHWRTPKEQGGLGGVTIGEKIRRDVLAGLVDPDDGRDRGAGDMALGPKPVIAVSGQGADHG